ncbi:MAG: hypothetical protein LBP76_03840 [Treponema sp.]|nr:hypothetical protein [Treponema sp.]
MPLLQVAQMENRSISQQTIVLLKNALHITQERKLRRKYILKEINALNIKNTDDFPDPAKINMPKKENTIEELMRWYL